MSIQRSYRVSCRRRPLVMERRDNFILLLLYLPISSIILTPSWVSRSRRLILNNIPWDSALKNGVMRCFSCQGIVPSTTFPPPLLRIFLTFLIMEQKVLQMRWHSRQFLPRRSFAWLIHKVSSPASAFVSDRNRNQKVNGGFMYHDFTIVQPTNPDTGVYVLLE